MGRIQSSIGLITGTNIGDTVEKLISLSGQPRDRLKSRVEGLKQQQSAIGQLTVLVVGLQLAGRRLGDASVFNGTKVSSAQADSIDAVKNGSPVAGDYFTRVVQLAQTHTAISAAVQSSTASLGKNGSIEIRSAGFVDESQRLEDLNGGNGVQAGSIRITDRSGGSAVVDLRGARTVDDVLATINRTSGIRVSASVDGDRFVLKDTSGGTGQFRVDEVGATSTASDLGFTNAVALGNSLQGNDISRLSRNVGLSSLNGGLGVSFNASGNDLQVNLKDGTALTIDFGSFSRAAGNAKGTTNASDPNARLTVQAIATGGADDGVTVKIIDDPSITAGSESVELLETSQGKQLVFHADVGNSTAAQLSSALAANSTLSSRFISTAGGTGAGTVSTSDTTVLNGGAALTAPESPTLGNLIDHLNSVSSGKLTARLSASGDSLELLDLTSGSSAFSVANLGGSSVVEDLGLTSAASGGTLTSTRLADGLRSVGLKHLGTVGATALGSVQINLCDGSSGTVNLATATTLQDVINGINSSGLAVQADYNDAGTGLSLRDLSGGVSTQLTVTSVDDTATRLGLTGTANDNILQGSGLNRRFVSLNTELSQLNQGRGVPTGSFTITDSAGESATLNLTTLAPKTVGDVVRGINDLAVAVTARVNSSGDGIELIDTGGGGGNLRVTDSGTGTAAKALRIAGTAERRIVEGSVKQIIDGSQVDRISFTATDSLATIAEKITAKSQLATASISTGGSTRLQIVSQRGGGAGRIAVSGNDLGIDFRTAQKGQDALLAIGGADSTNPQIFRSSDGVFTTAVAGVTLTAKSVSDKPVKVSVTSDPESLINAVNTFVDQYNKVVSQVDTLTFFDAEKKTTGLLFGSGEVLKVRQGLSRSATSRYGVKGSLKTLQSIGVSINDQGKLSLSSSKLREEISKRPDDVKSLLSEDKVGFQFRLNELTEQLAGIKDSALLSKNKTLTEQIDSGTSRVDSLSLRLEEERTRLLKQFNAMEKAISKIQNNQSSIAAITAAAGFSVNK